MKKLILATLIFSSSFLMASQQEAILDQIIRKAEERYPDSYSMQEYFIKSELESLAEVIKLKAKIANLKGKNNGL